MEFEKHECSILLKYCTEKYDLKFKKRKRKWKRIISPFSQFPLFYLNENWQKLSKHMSIRHSSLFLTPFLNGPFKKYTRKKYIYDQWLWLKDSNFWNQLVNLLFLFSVFFPHCPNHKKFRCFCDLMGVPCLTWLFTSMQRQSLPVFDFLNENSNVREMRVRSMVQQRTFPL